MLQAPLLSPSFKEAISEKTKIEIQMTETHGEDINGACCLFELILPIALPASSAKVSMDANSEDITSPIFFDTPLVDKNLKKFFTAYVL
jgi:hypothetical protein